MRRVSKRVGDRFFPLEVDPKDIDRNHDLVESVAEVSQFASASLQKYQGESGKVTGVVIRHSQVAGFEVEVEGETLLGTVKDFYVKNRQIKNPHLQSLFAYSVRQTLEEWLSGVNYMRGDGSAIQSLFWDLATVTKVLIIELVWKDERQSVWEIVIPSGQDDVVVQLHNIQHDGVCSLGVQVYSTRGYTDPAKSIGAEDHWERTLLWTRTLMEKVESSKEIYALTTLTHRNKKLRSLVSKILPRILHAFEKQYGKPASPPILSVGFSDWKIQAGHIGLYLPPNEERPYGVLSIHPKAIDKGYHYLRMVVAHELIHYVMTEISFEDPHGEEFQEMADRVGLPKKLQD